MKKLVWCLTVAVVFEGVSAPLLAPVFSQNAVVQRDVAAPVWGWAGRGETVVLYVQRVEGAKTNELARYKAVASQAVPEDANRWERNLWRWEMKIGPFPAGIGYRIVVEGSRATNGGKPQRIEADVAFGDVWLCAGQSNMELPLRRCRDATNEIARGTNPLLKLYNLPWGASAVPEECVRGGWTPCDSENLGAHPKKDFSGVAFFFGRELVKDVKVPLGLVNCSMGGTCIEAWISSNALETAGEKYRAPYEKYAQANGLNKPGVMFNAKVAVLKDMAVKGVLWYQGEWNTHAPQEYANLLRTMIGDWRGRLTAADPKRPLPFAVVLLAGFGGPNTNAAEPQNNWALLREAQIEGARSLPSVGLASAMDTDPVNGDLHPPHKQELGRRLARWAFAEAYGGKGETDGPTFKSVTKKGSVLHVSFAHVGQGLVAADGQELGGFAVASEKGNPVAARAVIKGDTVAVASPKVVDPCRVWYAWKQNPATANLGNADGFPALPFRAEVPPAPPAAAPIADRNPYSFCYHIVYDNREWTAINRDLKAIKKSGAGAIRADIMWPYHWKDPETGKYSFDNVERSLRLMERNGLGYLPIINCAPDKSSPVHEHLAEWEEFITQLVTQFRGRISHWEIWNEHNFTNERYWGSKDRKVHAAHYAEALKSAYRTIKSIDPAATVVYGGTAYVPIDYIRETFDAGATNAFDVMNVHPYQTEGYPEYLGSSIDALRKMMDGYGLKDKPIWVTEVGWSTSPRPSSDVYKRLLPPAFKALGIDTRRVPLVTLGDVDTPFYDFVAAFPKFRSTLRLPQEKLATLDPKKYPVLLPVRGETYPGAIESNLVEYVRRGGTIILPSGYPFCTPQRPADAPDWKPMDIRKALHLYVAFPWTHGYPTCTNIVFSDGKSADEYEIKAQRFLMTDWLKENDRLIPVAWGEDPAYREGKFAEKGFRMPFAGAIKYGSDLKGGAVIVTDAGQGVRCSIPMATQADFIVRANLILQAHGVERTFWYSFISDRRGEHSDNVEAGYGVTFREANGQVTPKPAYEAYQRLTQHCPPGSTRPQLEDSGEVWTARWRKPDGTPVVASWRPRGDGKVRFKVGSEPASRWRR